jgi:hypothetical protein
MIVKTKAPAVTIRLIMLDRPSDRPLLESSVGHIRDWVIQVENPGGRGCLPMTGMLFRRQSVNGGGCYHLDISGCGSTTEYPKWNHTAVQWTYTVELAAIRSTDATSGWVTDTITF